MNHREETFSISVKEWKHLRKTKLLHKEREHRLSKYPLIQKIQSEIPTFKTSKKEQIQAYLSYMSIHLDTLLNFYSPRRYRRMKMESYSNEKKVYHQLMETCYRKAMKLSEKDWKKSFSKKKRKLQLNEWKASTLIILGDGNFDHASKGHEPSPSAKRLFEEFRKRGYMIYWIDEFRTSKLCSRCHSEVESCKHPIREKKGILTSNDLLKPFILSKRKQRSRLFITRNKRYRKFFLKRNPSRKNNTREHEEKEDPSNPNDNKMNHDQKKNHYQSRKLPVFRSHEPWGVRLCSNKECRITWNRDRNSSHNMMMLTWMILIHGKENIPNQFKRPVSLS